MITWKQYSDRMISLNMQFDMAQKALSGFKDTPEAVERYVADELDSIRQSIRKSAKKSGVDPTTTWAFTTEGVDRFLGGLRSGLPIRLAEVENRLRQNELIFLVAVFEAFMKDFHREVLRQKPSLLRSNRTVPIGRVIATGWQNVLEEEIERETQTLDRKSVAERAKYFHDTLDIDWFDGKIDPLLERVIELRNVLLHSDPDREIDHRDVGLAHMVCYSIPWVSIVQAAVLYPHGFEQIKGVSEEDARRLYLERKHGSAGA